jgi:hypothetical protein
MTEAINADAATALAEFRGTPEQATAALAAKAAAFRPAPSATPQDAAGARARLDQLVSSESWYAKFKGGDREAKAEWTRLNAVIAESDPIANALAGKETAPPMMEVVFGKELPSRALSAAVADLREAGFPDDAIRHAVQGHLVSHQEHEAATRLRANRLSDPVWVANYLKGCPAEVRESKLLSVIINSEIAAGPSRRSIRRRRGFPFRCAMRGPASVVAPW